MKKLILALGLFLLPILGRAAIVEDNSLTQTSSASFSFNALGTYDTVIVVQVYDSGSGSLLSGITFDGSPLVKSQQENAGTAGRAETWTILAPASGAQTLALTFAGATPAVYQVVVTSFDNVASIGAVNGNSVNLVGGDMPLSGTATSGNVSVFMVGALAGGNSIFQNQGTHFTSLWSNSTVGYTFLNGYQPADASGMEFYCGCNDLYTGSTVELVEAALTPTDTPSISATKTPTDTPTLSPSITKTETISPSPTQSDTLTPSPTPTRSPTTSPTPTWTPTNSPSPTWTPTITQTFTISPTLTLTPTGTPAFAAPSGVTLGILQPNNTCAIYWNYEAGATAWKIFFNGNVAFTVSSSQVQYVTITAQDYFLMTIPTQNTNILNPISITMTAGEAGQPFSSSSLPVYLTTALSPWNMVRTEGAQPVSSTVITVSTTPVAVNVTTLAGTNMATNIYLGTTMTSGTTLYSFSDSTITPVSDNFYWSYTNGNTPITPQQAKAGTILWLKTASGTYILHLEAWQ